MSLKIQKKGNDNLYFDDEQTTQWPTEKKYKQTKKRSTKHTHKAKDRVTRTPLRTAGELRCTGRVSSSCFTNDTRRVNLVSIDHALAYKQQQRHEHRNMFILYMLINDLQKLLVTLSVLLIKSHILVYICCISHLYLIYQECVMFPN